MLRALTSASVIRLLAEHREVRIVAKGKGRKMGVNTGMGKKSSMTWAQRRANGGQLMRQRAGLKPIGKPNYQGMGVVKGS